MANAADARQRTVVVADDEPDLFLLLERILERADFDIVAHAEDGEQAIEFVREHQPDAVLLDLSMPRLDGEAALPTILRDAPRTMVAILSANLDPERAERVLLRGAFTAYDKGDLSLLPDFLGADLDEFQRVLDGEDLVPAWQHRYRRL